MCWGRHLPNEKKDDKERIKTEKEAVIAAAASWNLKDLTEKAKKAPADRKSVV